MTLRLPRPLAVRGQVGHAQRRACRGRLARHAYADQTVTDRAGTRVAATRGLRLQRHRTLLEAAHRRRRSSMKRKALRRLSIAAKMGRLADAALVPVGKVLVRAAALSAEEVQQKCPEGQNRARTRE